MVLFIIANKQEQPIYPSPDKWVNTTCYTYAVEYYLAVKTNEVLIRATKWMNPENMIRERSQTQKTTCCVIPFI